MKKIKTMRVASVLLVLTLLTTSVISGTFAKYVTADSSTDSATVAKWGIVATVSGNLFGKSYVQTENNQIAKSADTVTVSASADVVAPGTKNDTGLKIAVSGTPEVDYKIEATKRNDAKTVFLSAGTYGVMVQATGVNADSALDNLYTLDKSTYTVATEYDAETTYYELINKVTLDSAYYPIVWKVTRSGTTAITETANLSSIQNSIANGLAKTGKAEDDSDASYTITWEWKFSQNDGADTILGDLAAGNFGGTVVMLRDECYVEPVADTNYSTTVSFDMSVTVTQVD